MEAFREERLLKIKKEVGVMSRKVFLGLAALAFTFLITAKAMATGTPAGTVISNQAYVDYKDANSNPLTRAYSNIVTSTVKQVASLSAAWSSPSTQAAPMTPARFA